jgi:hypothetical protein
MDRNSTGYGPSARRKSLDFDGNGERYELWEEQFFGYLRRLKLLHVVAPRDESLSATPASGTETPASETVRVPTRSEKADVYAEMIQFLDDKSLQLVFRDAKNDGPAALKNPS